MGTATAILLMAMAVIACGGGGAATTSAAPGPSTGVGAQPSTVGTQPPRGAALDPCALLTDADIEQVTGRAVDNSTPGSLGGSFSNACSWELARGDADITPVTIDLAVISPHGVEYYETNVAPFETTRISGIGDEAVVDGAGGITAVKGDTLVSVLVIAVGQVDETFTRELTQAALSRVP